VDKSARKRRVPAVLDADEVHYMPSEVWVPIRPPAEGATEVALELRETASNGLALVAFSSAEALVTGCGPGQLFVTIPAADLKRLRHVVDFSCVVLDQGLPEQAQDAPLPEVVADDSLTSGLVYLPSRPHRPGARHADIKLFELETGEIAMLAYSSPQQLRACRGTKQAWVSIPPGAVEETCHQLGADVVVFDHKP
jgi:hypothetical protein